MVMEGVQEEMGDGNMQCLNHPYKNHTPGGICAFCLQEKLGKLVSSSFPIAVFPSSSSSPSPSFRSDPSAAASSSSTLPVRQNASTNSNAKPNNDFHYQHHHHQYYSRRGRIPFFPTKKKNPALAHDQAGVVFKRSKSTTTPRRRGLHFMDSTSVVVEEDSPRKRGFWSFLYHSKHADSRHHKSNKEICYSSSSSTMGGFPQRSRETQKREEEFSVAVVVEEEANDGSPNQAARVSRSRSVGCGSRSFSGDFFERISTGFGDCTLRRVESQREGKPRTTTTPAHRHRGGGQDCIKERVKCGGLFSGFMITSSSSSSSSSSYWVSSSSAEDGHMNGKMAAAAAAAGQLTHGRSKSWGWAFASPIRAFSKPSSSKREAPNKNTTPNLNTIPSLLAVGG